MLPIQHCRRLLRHKWVNPIGLACRPLYPCFVLWLFFRRQGAGLLGISGYKLSHPLGAFPLVDPLGPCASLARWRSPATPIHSEITPNDRPLDDRNEFSTTITNISMTCRQPARTEGTSETIRKSGTCNRCECGTRHSNGIP